MRFASEAVVRQHAVVTRQNTVTPLKTEDMVLLPIYLGRYASRVDEISEVKVVWLVAAISLGMENHTVVLQSKRVSTGN